MRSLADQNGFGDMNKTQRKSDQGVHMINTSDRCAIAVVYTDRQSRQRAMGLCDSLAGHLPKELQLEFTWWNTRYLHDSQVAQLAADALADSDMVLVSASDAAMLAPEVKNWLERGMRQPHSRERALAAYLDKTDRQADTPSLDLYLRDVARRAHVDYLTLEPPEPSQATSEQPQNISIRPSAPSHWGINE
jgi:hypothetical protein